MPTIADRRVVIPAAVHRNAKAASAHLDVTLQEFVSEVVGDAARNHQNIAELQRFLADELNREHTSIGHAVGFSIGKAANDVRRKLEQVEDLIRTSQDAARAAGHAEGYLLNGVLYMN